MRRKKSPGGDDGNLRRLGFIEQDSIVFWPASAEWPTKARMKAAGIGHLAAAVVTDAQASLDRGRREPIFDDERESRMDRGCASQDRL